MQSIFEFKSKLFIVSQIVFLFSVFVSSFFEEFLRGRDIIIFFFLLGTFLFLIYFWEKKSYRIILIMILFLFLGAWRFSVSIHEMVKNEIGTLNGTKQIVEGTIKNNPEISQKNQQFILKVNSIGEKEYLGNLLVFADTYPDFSYGDKIRLECKLNIPEPIEDFSYDKFLAMKNIYSICYYPEIEYVSGDNGSKVLSLVYKIKNNFRESINKNIGEPSSSIMNAMVLGEKKFLSDDIQLKFSRAGISHIIAISGMHIGVFVVGLGFLFFFFGFSRNFSFYLILFFLIFYNILIAFPASALRASFMGILILYAFKIGRLNKIYNLIILAASIIILINPMLIRYDLGFIFSFSALLGIIYFFPIFDKYFKGINNRFLKYSIGIINVSLAAQIFILPLIIKNFGVLSIISPLVNLFVIWSLPFILIGVVAAFTLLLIFPALSFYLFLPVNFLISYILFVVDFFLKIPFSSFEINNLPDYYYIFYYIVIFSFIFYCTYLKKTKIRAF